MLKKVLIGLGVTVTLVVGYWLVSPLFIEKRVSESLEDILPPSAVTETVSEIPETAAEEKVEAEEQELPVVLSEGEFIGLAGHSGEGTVKLLEIGGKYYVRFEEDFRVTNGPDLFVYFGQNGEYATDARIERLKGNVGSQNYEVPPKINPLNYNEVWVWCRAFSVPFAKVLLN